MRPLMRPCCINTYIQTVCGGLVVACVTGCAAWHFSVETRMEGKLSKLEEKMDRKFTEMDRKFTEKFKILDQKFDQTILMLNYIETQICCKD